MTTLLLVGLCLLLLACLGLVVTAGMEWLAAQHRRRCARAEAFAAEIRLQRLTRQAMQQLLDEVRRAQGGVRP